MDQVLRVNKVRVDEVKEFKADKKTQWLDSILLELLEDCGHGKEDLGKSDINLSLKVEKEHFDEFGEVLFCHGQVNLQYLDISVQSGESIEQKLEITVNCAFLEEHNEKKHQLEEEITIFFGEQEWDLYYHNRNMADMKSVIHEYVFLNKNPYPGMSNE